MNETANVRRAQLAEAPTTCDYTVPAQQLEIRETVRLLEQLTNHGFGR